MIFEKISKLVKSIKARYKKFVEFEEKEYKPAPEFKNTTSKGEKRYVHLALSDITKAILIMLAIGALGFLIYEIRDILILFFVSMLFAAALDPTIDLLQRFKIPRGISVLVIFIVLIGLSVLFVGNLIPILANELLDLALKAQDLIGNLASGKIVLPKFLQWLDPIIAKTLSGINSEALSTNLQNYLLQFSDQLQSLAGNAVKTFIAISNGIANAILVLMLTYFMSVDEKSIDKFLLSLFPSKYGEYITHKSLTIKSKIGDWLRGQLGLMLAVGIVTYIGLVILGVEYPFTLALFAGVTELIPVVGPLIGWVAAVPIAANQSGTMVLWVTILYFVIQRLENNLLVPVIMKKATGLNPIVVVFAMLVGYQFLGILGVIISVPVAAGSMIFIEDYLVRSK